MARAILSVIVFLGSIHLATAQLGEAARFNGFVFEQTSLANGFSEAGLAIGGDAQISNWNVGQRMNATTSESLIVGGNLTYQNGWVNEGNVRVRGLTAGNFVVSNGSRQSGGMDARYFTDQKFYSVTQSMLITRMQETGQVESRFGGLWMTTTTSSMAVFRLNATALENANTLRINAPNASAVIIDVEGQSARFVNSSFTLVGTQANKVLLNFRDAFNLEVSGVNFRGTILAPRASVAFRQGNIYGQLIANRLTSDGGGYLRNTPFTGDLSSTVAPILALQAAEAVPEPTSLAAVGTFVLMLIARRKRS